MTVSVIMPVRNEGAFMAHSLGAVLEQDYPPDLMQVLVADGEATVDAIKKSGGDAAFLPLDVTDDSSWERCIEGTIAELGGLDIVVNNAGVEITQLVADLDPDAVRKMLEVNILGTSLGIKHAFRAMRPGGPAGRGGAVVNIASVAATIAFPGIAVYSATKSAVDRLTRVSAMEAGKLGYGVRVNCICPGGIATPIFGKSVGLSPERAEEIIPLMKGVLQLPAGPLAIASRS